jgi:hypothetical protein
MPGVGRLSQYVDGIEMVTTVRRGESDRSWRAYILLEGRFNSIYKQSN